ncbi:MAG: hypothetical protein WHS88_06315 [Anaerohalosphaeraceae bacterium]
MGKILSFSLFIPFFVGCSGKIQDVRTLSSSDETSVSQVLLINAKKFPSEAAGVWINEDYGWILRIEKDGRLSKIRHTIGRAALKTGETTSVPLINNGHAVIEPGPWYVQYDGKIQTVTIEINIRNFFYDIGGGNVVKGSSRDVFMGPLPQKGEDRWVLNWLSFPEYIASTGDKEFLDYKLPFEPGDEDKGEIVFQRFQ